MSGNLLRIRVTLKGRPVRSYSFNKDVITVGRNPESDVFLDNPGISRDHCKLELRANDLYEVLDLNSANGILVNDVAVNRRQLMNNDVVRIGKYALWMTYEADRRADTGHASAGAWSGDEGTTVLSTSELEAMIDQARLAEPKTPVGATTQVGAGATDGEAGVATPGVDPRRARRVLLLATLLAFIAGYAAASVDAVGFWRSAIRPLSATTTSSVEE